MKEIPDSVPLAASNSSFSIPTYVVNLKKRSDRKEHVIAQFEGRHEFKLNIVEAFEHSFGALGLWATIRYIMIDRVPPKADYIIICEDDVEFTEDYSSETLFEAIAEAQKFNADVLLGGVSWVENSVQISNQLFWTNYFSGLQFTVVFNKFFDTLRQARLNNYKAADYHMANLSDDIILRYPFLAIQKDFGYSDATPKNNEKGVVDTYFTATTENLLNQIKVQKLYKSLPRCEIDDLDYDHLAIPTYIINLPERTERLAHIKAEFAGKNEFEVQIVDACKHEIGAFGLWMSIRKVIEIAIANDDDVIIIAEDDHQFTDDYNKEFLIRNVVEANEEGACLLSGGSGKFNTAVPVTANRYWVNHLLSTQFMVVYRRFFQDILDEPFDKEIVADLTYSRITPYKMLLYPFISKQKDFGYSDITSVHNQDKGLITRMFSESEKKLKSIQTAYLKYNFETTISNQ